MREVKIYTCGKMSGIPYEEQMRWRNNFTSCLKKENDFIDRKITIINPPIFYNYEHKVHKTEREILDWEMKQLHDCDIVVINFDGIDSTVGSHMELGAIQGINRFGDKYIFVIGIGKEDELHPWILETCNRIEPDCESAAKYVAEYLLI